MTPLAVLVLAATLQAFNDDMRPVEVRWRQLEPVQTAEQSAVVDPKTNFDTHAPTGKGEVYRIVFRRGRRDVVKPVIAINVETAYFLQPPRRRPYTNIRPFYRVKDFDLGMSLASDRHPTSLYCTSIELRQWQGHTIGILNNGVFMELGGNVQFPETGRQCYCGRAIDSPDKQSELARFEAVGLCH